MSRAKIISFRADANKIDALDSLAAAQGRPRSRLINEAISNYVELHAGGAGAQRNGRHAERPRGRPCGRCKTAQEDGPRTLVIEWTDQAATAHSNDRGSFDRNAGILPAVLRASRPQRGRDAHATAAGTAALRRATAA
ncbi:MAG: ribbon-helix-helix domain-containing protein [Terriglobales bacterium]